MAAPGVTNRKRLLVLLLGVTVILFGLIVRIGYIQMVWGIELQKMALDQWTRDLKVNPKRGIIYDRNGIVLAQSASADTVAARPNQIKDARLAASQLAPILDMDEETLYQRLSDTKKSEVWLKRQITKDAALKVRSLEIDGIVFTEESKRYYPNKNLASHILGFTGIDGEGQDGIELYYDKQLRGYPGKIVTETDAKGRDMPYNVDRYIPPINGWNLVLTIDQVIQHFAEKAVSDAMDKYQAKKVYAIVMDPKTGDILALANRPDFDPNAPPRELGAEKMNEFVKNFAAKDVYEPGSTFKIITAASGLDAGVVTVNDTFDDPGYKIVDGQRIKCWKAGGHGHQTFVEGVQNSCNPVFMETALRLGQDRFDQYIRAFGFGQKTGLDVYGEENGLVRNKDLVKNVDLARIGFGQSIAVTPLQLVTAVSAVVNGGYVMEPHLAKEFRDEDGGLIEAIPSRKVRQVISKKTSDTMREILQSVVSEGSGKNAYIPGYRVGGKTGTAQKYENGVPSHNKLIASFVGFAPADDPQVVVLVVVDEPNAPVIFGSTVAAPYVKMILEDTLPYLGVEPVFNEETEKQSKLVTVPDVMGMSLNQAVRELRNSGLQYMSDESGTIVQDMMPKPGAEVLVDTTVLLKLQTEAEQQDAEQQTEKEKVVVPDVIGMSIREANMTLVSANLKLKIDGSGLAISQNPAAGAQVDADTEVTVVFEIPGE